MLIGGAGTVWGPVLGAIALHLIRRIVGMIRNSHHGGTLIVPGHGYLSNEHEVVEYRDMVVIVRDRVRAMIAAAQERSGN